MFLGIKGLRNCIQYKHDGVFAVAFLGCNNYRPVPIIITENCRFICGNWQFCLSHNVKMSVVKVHTKFFPSRKLTTLSDSMQLVDELSMIYTTCLMCYATFSFARSRLFRQILGFGLLFLSVFITVSIIPSRHENSNNK